MSRLNVLALSFFPALLPPDNGGVTRLHELYLSLSRFCKVTLISSGEVGRGIERIRHSINFEEIRVGKNVDFEVAYSELINDEYKGDLSGPANAIWSSQYGPLHDVYLENYREADVIIHDSPFLINVDIFRGVDDKPRIYNSYNIESHLYESFEARDGCNRISQLVREFEQELCDSVDLLTGCSDDDIKAFKTEFGYSGKSALIPNGVMRKPPVSKSGTSRRDVIFLGSNHRPNNDAAEYIRKTLAPAMPDVTFHVVGSCHPALKHRNFISHGFLSAAAKREIFANAVIAINPVVTGSGSSLKMVEFAVADMPILSTGHGARGFGFEPDVHFIQSDLDEFQEKLRALLDDESARSRVARNALGHVNSNYSWDAISEKFFEELKSALTHKVKGKPTALVLNDYDSFTNTGGGCIRTVGLCRGLSEAGRVLFVCLGAEGEQVRQVFEAAAVVVRVPKSAEHLMRETHLAGVHWMSVSDILAYAEAPRNDRLIGVAAAACDFARTVICEHPYMVGVPRRIGCSFVYSSQNFEYGLKASSLGDHPHAAELLAAVEEAERFACAASSLIVNVSAEDAAAMSSFYQHTAPLVVIRNGADLNADTITSKSPKRRKHKRPIFVFMGSGHAPNIEAAQWILDKLAPQLPNVDFVIIGSCAGGVSGVIPDNVKLPGVVNEVEKHRLFATANAALNPMLSGSGSNIKVADYLQHGLRVVSTAFGARGYEDIPESDLIIVELPEFAEQIESIKGDIESVRSKRTETYKELLSMKSGGRRLGELVFAPPPEKRALYVTYRYQSPSQGGGEYYVDRLIHSLSRTGWAVDVVSPDAGKISDNQRFAAQFSSPSGMPVAINNPLIRSSRFAVSENDCGEELHEAWATQPAFEKELISRIPSPSFPALGWGWAWPQLDGRWMFSEAGLYSREPSNVRISGRSMTKMWVRMTDADGALVHETTVDGKFQLSWKVGAGWSSILATEIEPWHSGDSRPLTLFVSSVQVGGCELVGGRLSDLLVDVLSPEEIISAMHEASIVTRHARDIRLTAMRAPSCELTAFVQKNIATYDLVITHNAVFETATNAVKCAKAAGIPSIIIPHLHLDDDFYHFQDVWSSCATATAALVCPSSVAEFMQQKGLTNVAYFSPGIDAEEQFSAEDEMAFRKLLGSDEPFFLVLGRKAAAKGYRDIIQAAGSIKGGAPLIVLIGPDDDGEPVDVPHVKYLGLQDRSILRGALRSCTALINMSSSESFGIVLLEAGAAGRPVIANSECAAFQDLVTEGQNGLLVDRTGLADAMIFMLNNPDAATAMGEAGRVRAHSYDWKLIEERFVELCNQVGATRDGI